VASLAENLPGARPPEVAALAGRHPVTAEGRVVVPLHGIASLQGVLSVALGADAAEPVDLDALSAVAQQAGLALDRATLYERSATVAHELQQSLLSAEAPTDERFVVTTRYRPGVVGLEVGGDWYDSFVAGPDVLSVVVGDVVGKGLGAASRMGQLRSAVRAVAGPGVTPAALLTRLDRFVAQVAGATSTTLAYGEVDLGTGRVRYACAGHVPPVLIPADGPPRLLWDGRSTPLGVGRADRPRTDAEVQLAPGDQLLLYTDGLIERRDRPLPARLGDLVEAASDLHRRGPEDATATIMDRLLSTGESPDDVCLLLLGWNG
jgi:serine phosphatase RsbU (regulator of sigma subunit)